MGAGGEGLRLEQVGALMAIMGVTSLLPRKTTILPESGRDFLHRRMMELVGVGVAAAGVVLLLALFTYSPGDPSLNHATGSAPHNIVGLPGAYISDLLLQTFGLAIVLVPVALITWGVSVACIGLGDVGGAATHAGAGGLVGLALVGRFREIVLTHSSGGSLALIEPVCAALAFIAMAPALGMNRTDLPLIFRILRAPFLWGGWLMRAALGLWRGKPQPFDEDSDLPAPAIGYAEIPGEIDASQYDPARFETRLEQIPEEGAPLPARDSLMVDAPYAPIERPTDGIPEAPPRTQEGPLQPHATPSMAADSVRDRTLFDRLAGLRIEPILGRLRPVAPPPVDAEPMPPMPVEADSEPVTELADDNPFTPDELGAEPPPAAAAAGVTIVPRKSAVAQGKRAAKAGQRELDLIGGEYRLPPLDILALPSRVTTETKIDEGALEQNARLLETVLDDFGVKGQIVKVRPGPVVTLYELEPAPGTKSSRVIGLADDIARSMSAVSARVAT